jgi:hypothetical protein
MNLGDMKVYIPKLETPKINLKVAELSAAQIKGMKNEEIISTLTGEKDVGGMLPLALQQALTNELLTRTIKSSSKPHWSVTYNFWATVIAAIASCAAVYLAIFPPRSSQPAPEVRKTVQQVPAVQSVASSSRMQLLHTQPKLSSTQRKKP